jgi:hypothetical protein
MRGIKRLQHFSFIVQNVDAWNSLRKTVATDSHRAERGKLLERKLHHCSKFKIPKTRSQPTIVILSLAKDLFVFLEAVDPRCFAPINITARKASTLLEI